MIAIVDCGIGNLSSVKNAFDYLKAESMIVGTPDAILDAERIVLPGVGAFGFMMQNLREKGIAEPIRNSIASGKPFLGICLGMQALFERSEEAPRVKGLNLLKGSVRRIPGRVRLPQMGWNSISMTRASALLKGIRNGERFYFANSYACFPEEDVITAVCDYGGEFAAVVEKGNFFGVQFHPEKSGEAGLRVLKNFVELCR